MFIERIDSPGLAHMSWVVGSGGQAAVVDPRRDCEVYVEAAERHGARIVLILETHRNEDLISGAPILAALTGAEVLHGPNPAAPVAYARTAREGETFQLGAIELRVLETPGHTDDSLSFVVVDRETGDAPVGVFTGDALFVGDVGRTDFYPDRAREVAGALYDSLQKLLAIGDQAVIFPAHGSGSVCGSNMASRRISTLGIERLYNPRLRIESREAFIDAKVAERHVTPPYFARMEALNLSGSEPMASARSTPMMVEEFAKLAERSVVVDVRGPEAFLGAHIPGSIAFAGRLVSGYAGWFLGYDDDLALVASSPAQARAACEELGRIGYDRVRGYLSPSLPGWASAGEHFETIPAIDAAELDRRLRTPPDGWEILDVRSDEEIEAGMLPGARHAYVGELPRHAPSLDPRQRYTVVCGSGARATLGASVLRRHGIRRVDVFLGAMRHLETPFA